MQKRRVVQGIPFAAVVLLLATVSAGHSLGPYSCALFFAIPNIATSDVQQNATPLMEASNTTALETSDTSAPPQNDVEASTSTPVPPTLNNTGGSDGAPTNDTSPWDGSYSMDNMTSIILNEGLEWQYLDESGWTSYDLPSTVLLEAGWRNTRNKTVELNRNGTIYEVTLQSPKYGMLQKNIVTGSQKKVRRKEDATKMAGLFTFRAKVLKDKRKKEEEAVKKRKEVVAAAQAAKVVAAAQAANISSTQENKTAHPEPEPPSKPAPQSGPVVDYASADAGAKVVASNRESIGASNVLNNDKNSYVRNPCSAKKWLVVELAQEILPNSVTVADHEMFSSSLKRMQVLGSKTFPVKNWILLGEFDLSNVRGEQTRKLQYSDWTRYIKFRFLSHYGTEHYCTLTKLVVHGKTEMEDIAAQLEGTPDIVEEEQDVAPDPPAAQPDASATTETKPTPDEATPASTTAAENESPASAPALVSNVTQEKGTALIKAHDGAIAVQVVQGSLPAFQNASLPDADDAHVSKEGNDDLQANNTAVVHKTTEITEQAGGSNASNTAGGKEHLRTATEAGVEGTDKPTVPEEKVGTDKPTGEAESKKDDSLESNAQADVKGDMHPAAAPSDTETETKADEQPPAPSQSQEEISSGDPESSAEPESKPVEGSSGILDKIANKVVATVKSLTGSDDDPVASSPPSVSDNITNKTSGNEATENVQGEPSPQSEADFSTTAATNPPPAEHKAHPSSTDKATPTEVGKSATASAEETESNAPNPEGQGARQDTSVNANQIKSVPPRALEPPTPNETPTEMDENTGTTEHVPSTTGETIGAKEKAENKKTEKEKEKEEIEKEEKEKEGEEEEVQKEKVEKEKVEKETASKKAEKEKSEKEAASKLAEKEKAEKEAANKKAEKEKAEATVQASWSEADVRMVEEKMSTAKPSKLDRTAGSIFHRIVSQLKALEQNQTVIADYLESSHARYSTILDELQKDFDAMSHRQLHEDSTLEALAHNISRINATFIAATIAFASDMDAQLQQYDQQLQAIRFESWGWRAVQLLLGALVLWRLERIHKLLQKGSAASPISKDTAIWSGSSAFEGAGDLVTADYDGDSDHKTGLQSSAFEGAIGHAEIVLSPQLSQEQFSTSASLSPSVSTSKSASTSNTRRSMRKSVSSVDMIAMKKKGGTTKEAFRNSFTADNFTGAIAEASQECSSDEVSPATIET